MKTLLGVLAFLTLIPLANADRLDKLNAFPVTQYCMQVTDFFKNGMEARRDGYARKISQLTPEGAELLEHHQPLPKDSMWNMGWDQLNAREKQFMQDRVFEGWDVGDDLIKASRELDYDTVERSAQTYFDRCIEKRSEILHSPKTRIKDCTEGCNLEFHRVASNQNIGDKSPELCKEIKWDVEVITGAIEENVSEDALATFAVKSQRQGDLTEERLNRILTQIRSAYEWAATKPIDEWAANELKGCD